ncbi:MAG: hypothetical protein ACOX6F_00920, partial [Syntrophomonadaceae bacterium]
LRLPSDPTVTSDALALGLSSRWLGDRASFSPSAQQTCWSNDCPRATRSRCMIASRFTLRTCSVVTI